jgi:DNA-binding MarR family transcriptional regulator
MRFWIKCSLNFPWFISHSRPAVLYFESYVELAKKFRNSRVALKHMKRHNGLPPYEHPGLALLMWRHVNYYQRLVKPVLKRHGITYLQFNLLEALIHPVGGQAVSQAQLAELLCVAQRTVGKAVYRLAEKHFVILHFKEDIFDRRANIVRIHPQGLHTLRLIKAETMMLNQEWLSHTNIALPDNLSRNMRPPCQTPKARSAWWRQTHGPAHAPHP